MRKKELDDQERHNQLLDKLVEEAREKGLPPPEYTGAPHSATLPHLFPCTQTS
jgi:hypothetical protein